MAEMTVQETNDLPADLQGSGRTRSRTTDRHTRSRAPLALEHVVDVRHARHPRVVNAKDGLRPPADPTLDPGGGREGGLPPSR